MVTASLPGLKYEASRLLYENVENRKWELVILLLPLCLGLILQENDFKVWHLLSVGLGVAGWGKGSLSKRA